MLVMLLIEKDVAPLPNWRDIKVNYEDEDFSDKNVRGRKEKWVPPSESEFMDKESDKQSIESLLNKWKYIGEAIMQHEEKQPIKGLKEKWETPDIDSPVRSEEREKLIRMDDIEYNPVSSTEPNIFEGESSRRTVIRHLKNIASSQSRIISLLRRIEDKYRNDKRCGIKDMTKHRSIADDLNDLDMESLSMSDAAALSLG